MYTTSVWTPGLLFCVRFITLDFLHSSMKAANFFKDFCSFFTAFTHSTPRWKLFFFLLSLPSFFFIIPVWIIYRGYHCVYHSWTWTKWAERRSGSASRTIWHDTRLLMDTLWLFLSSSPWPFGNWMVPQTIRSPITHSLSPIDFHFLPWCQLCTIPYI